MRPMFPALLAALLTTLLIASGLSHAQVRRSDLQPLPEPPPMPIGDVNTNASIEPTYAPQVTVRKSDGDTIEEFRVSGRLVMIRVTPAHGIPYVLSDPRGDGSFSSRRDSLDSPPIVPMWVLFNF